MLKRTLSALGLLLVAALPFGCAQNDPDAPPIGGYSTGLVITKVTAIPDVIPADGISEATLRLEARLRDGDPLPGRAVAFILIGVDVGSIPGIGAIELKYCSSLSSTGYVRVATDVTDDEGVAWGVWRSGVGAVYGEVRPDEELRTDPATGDKEAFDPCVGGTLGTPAILYSSSNYRAVIRGKITDPRETESEAEVQDDVTIQHY